MGTGSSPTRLIDALRPVSTKGPYSSSTRGTDTDVEEDLAVALVYDKDEEEQPIAPQQEQVVTINKGFINNTGEDHAVVVNGAGGKVIITPGVDLDDKNQPVHSTTTSTSMQQQQQQQNDN